MYDIGQIVNLDDIVYLRMENGRWARVIEICKHYVVCRAIKGGYLECINTDALPVV